MSATIRKAVIPAVGIGSRMLPLTKALPKEMLPVGNGPVIERTVQELVDSGITDITIVVSRGKTLVEEHFRADPGLAAQLRADHKPHCAEAVERVADLSLSGHLTYIDQHGPYGNGTPVLDAARLIGDDPVVVLWPDEVFVSKVPRARQLIAAYEETGCPVLALQPLKDPADARQYGIPVIEEDLGAGRLRISGIVEKPDPEAARSGYAALGGYVITPGVVAELQRITDSWDDGQEGEFYLTEAINAYAACRPVYGQVIEGTWYDMGNPASYTCAQLALALADPVLGPRLRRTFDSAPAD